MRSLREATKPNYKNPLLCSGASFHTAARQVIPLWDSPCCMLGNDVQPPCYIGNFSDTSVWSVY